MSTPGYRYINSRQVLNVDALPNIGTPSDTGLDIILSAINAALAGLTAASGYYAQQANLTSGTTSIVVTIPEQLDTSFIVLAMMGNITDTHPQYQQVQVTSKARTGFTFEWNHPVDSSNYFISYIIPFKQFPEAESSIGSSANTLAATLAVPQAASTYPIIAQLQNLVDTNPEFQTVVVGNDNTTTANFSWNTLTDSSNYQMAYGILATGQVSVSSGVNSITISLPINYGSTGYAIVATIQNTSDSFPQYQPLLLSAKGDSSVTISWNIPTDVSSYVLSYYAISLTP
jgi:hypothetical protein